jgi:hypothetical protein
LFETYKIAATDEDGYSEELENLNDLVSNSFVRNYFMDYYDTNEEEINKLGLQEPFNLIK